ncbi:hypothetical protein RNZ50_10980 [Paracoccaceae bacterium Fryx2]|nr:hypothetical protein [Paracoccaceae bacterium Fryx2]
MTDSRVGLRALNILGKKLPERRCHAFSSPREEGGKMRIPNIFGRLPPDSITGRKKIGGGGFDPPGILSKGACARDLHCRRAF